MTGRIKCLVALAATLLAFAIRDAASEGGSNKDDRPWITHLLLAKTWPNGYSEVCLMEPMGTSIVSNIDFSLFGSTLTVETPEAIHNFYLMTVTYTPNDVVAEQRAGILDAKGIPKYWPEVLPPSTVRVCMFL